MRASIVLLCLVLGGCATCREHPVACAVSVGTVVVAGSILATDKAKHPDRYVKRVQKVPT